MTDSPSSASALVLSGGGARTAYQAGVLRFVTEAFPDATPEAMTGVGMGSVNAALWAAGGASPSAATDQLVRFWDEMTPADVFEARSIWDLVTQIMHRTPSENQSLLDLAPLRRTLTGILSPADDGTLPGLATRLDTRRLRALALTTSRYATGETVTWVQAEDTPPEIDDWEHGRRRAEAIDVTLDHVLASASLALLFPAVQIGGAWHGAGVGMLHPLAPAVRLGADRLLVVSTRPDASPDNAPATDAPAPDPYPSPLQIASLLSNTLLLDAPEQDAVTAERIDDLVRRLPPDDRPLSPADVCVLRPSTDLTALAEDLDLDIGDRLGATLRYLHAEDSGLPDLLSILLYAPEFVRRCLLLGYTDAETQADRIERVLTG
jgi:NTE family protein